VDESLTHVAEFAAHAIPGADEVGVSLAHPSAVTLHVQRRAVTAELVREIDGLQYEVHKEGPSITSMRTGRSSKL
ncbi:hypothetical protein MRAB57_4211, partial [Mycobacterium rhizamassiliense]|jgi:hypothetical protein